MFSYLHSLNSYANLKTMKTQDAFYNLCLPSGLNEVWLDHMLRQNCF